MLLRGCGRRRSTHTCICSRRSSRAPCARACSHATPLRARICAWRCAARRSTALSLTKRRHSWRRRASSTSAQRRAMSGADGSPACALRTGHGSYSLPSSASLSRRDLPRQPHRQPADAALSTGRRHPDARSVTRRRAVRAQMRARRPRSASCACSTPRRRRECAASTSTTISKRNSPAIGEEPRATRCGTPASHRSSPRAPIRSTLPSRWGTKTSPRRHLPLRAAAAAAWRDPPAASTRDVRVCRGGRGARRRGHRCAIALSLASHRELGAARLTRGKGRKRPTSAVKTSGASVTRHRK
jgi:hypothetical protein